MTFLGLLFAVLAPLLAVVAFTGPPATPPNGGGILSVSSGNLGVNNPLPSYTLDVSGTLRATGSWSLGGAAQTSLNMNGNDVIAVGKLSATTIDPVYDIGGAKYATYGPDIIGLKVEDFGKAKLSPDPDGGHTPSRVYSYVIDFANAPPGSDLWLFWQTISEGENMKDMMVTFAPEDQEADLWYSLNPAADQIIIHGDKPVTFSYTLVAPRRDADRWPSIAASTTEGSVPLIPK